MFTIIKNKLNYAREWFALLGVFAQLGVVTVLGLIIVMLSSFVMGSVENSYLIFVDPPSLPAMKDDPFKLFFSFLMMLFGLVVTGFIISVLSSSLENTFRDIRMGRLKFLGKNHTLIINYNHKIMKILQELNLLYEDNKDLHEVIILINNDEQIEKLQNKIKKLKFENLHIFVRYGDTLSWERYEEISIMNIHALIVLGREDIEDPFIRDNNNLRVANLLFSNEKFASYMREKRKNNLPVKAVVEFSDTHHFDSIVSTATESLFLAIAPSNVLSSILNLSMINIDYYSTWSQLLSFEDYEIYFIDPKLHNLVGSTYKDVLLRHEKGMLIGISRSSKGYQLLLNAQEESILENDFLIFIARDRDNIKFLDNTYTYQPLLKIEQPAETFVKNIGIIGHKRVIDTNNLLDMEKSTIRELEYNDEELFEKSSYDEFFEPKDQNMPVCETIIINLEDEMIYRIALKLRVLYTHEELKKFVFLVDDSLIAEHLEKAGFRNTILSHLLISKYIAQVANQLTLHKVFNILFVKEGPEINFIDADELPNSLVDLKYELVHNRMLYLGIIKKDGAVVFEADDLSEAEKIIVLSDGEFV